jgi:hypothetical protein
MGVKTRHLDSTAVKGAVEGSSDDIQVVWAVFWFWFWFLGRGCPIRKCATLARLLHEVSATGASAKHCNTRTPIRVSLHPFWARMSPSSRQASAVNCSSHYLAVSEIMVDC